MNLGNMLNERSLGQKPTFYMIPFHLYEMPRLSKSIETENKLVRNHRLKRKKGNKELVSVGFLLGNGKNVLKLNLLQHIHL